MVKDQIILGIDPGTTVMGYGIIRVSKNQPEMMAMGVLELRKYIDHYHKLQKIFSRTLSLVDEYKPDSLAIEAPFFGKNVQSMLKLGRAQGAAIAAALYRDLPVYEYAPLKIKMSITGNGRAAKEQVADMLRRYLKISAEAMLPQLDATDGLAAAYCHFLQLGTPFQESEYKSWKDYVSKNEQKVKNTTRTKGV
ncbi:MAG: crossover junction endodeoxyribonuclease RuvC [Bacteroidia bacterium]|nr:crossover junction endodeoxyribonuclease RuvC [Bacteroidia bacterium]